MLSSLRDQKGRPRARVRVLAIVLALLLAGPLTVVILRVLLGAVDLAL